MRELAGGYKMGTKPEHHESIRAVCEEIAAAIKALSSALETLAVVAYKQPITAPEIMDIRGVQGAGVLKTLLDRRLIATAGQKDVVGKPIMYKTTKEFLIQFGLSSLNELPTLKEFEELGRLSLADEISTAPEPPGSSAEADATHEMSSPEQRDDFEADSPATTIGYEVGVAAEHDRPNSEIPEAEATEDNPRQTESNG